MTTSEQHALHDARPRALVVGSANHDQIIRVDRLPAPGETILAQSRVTHAGGKGANQAVATARLGVGVAFVGCVGNDDSGALLLRELRAEGVDVSNVDIIGGAQTGVAIVHVVDDGENSITVVPGANFAQRVERVRGAVTSICDDDTIVVVQGELQPAIIEATFRAAADVGARVLCNLAPYVKLSGEALRQCDPLVVNETEAAQLAGVAIEDVESALHAAHRIQELGARSVAITLGAVGAVWAHADLHGVVEAPNVPEVVDTTGAGDAFVGAAVSSLTRGADLAEAVRYGVLAGSFAVTRVGAQSSYPVRGDLVEHEASAEGRSGGALA